MALYPYKFIATKNVKQAIVPVPLTQVFVYDTSIGGQGSTVLKTIYSGPDEAITSVYVQPVQTNTNGEIIFYAHAGRIKIESKIDSSTFVLHHDVIVDQDNITSSIINESPEGSVNGTNNTFGLMSSPRNNNVALYVDGLRYRLSLGELEAKEFSLYNKVITIEPAPTIGSVIIVDYLV